MKLRTLNVTLQIGVKRMIMLRYEFNHLLSCLGINISAWGLLSTGLIRDRLKIACRNFERSPSEFTVNECVMRVNKEPVTFAAIDSEKVKILFEKLNKFIEDAGDKDIHF